MMHAIMHAPTGWYVIHQHILINCRLLLTLKHCIVNKK